MEPTLYETLTPAEREDLALCGITSEEQLANCSSEQLHKDFAQARQFFPDRTFALTDAKLKALFPAARPLPEPLDLKPAWGRRAEPIAEFKRNTRHTESTGSRKNKQRNLIMHSPVRCTHRLTAILAAFCTLFLLIPLGSVVVFPYLMLTDNMPDVPLWILAVIVFVMPCIVYMCIARRATCPVCHMRIFRYSHYIRNRAAHHLPILGYNFATALHLLFFWKYNCPGCGTPIKLLGTKGHRTHC